MGLLSYWYNIYPVSKKLFFSLDEKRMIKISSIVTHRLSVDTH